MRLRDDIHIKTLYFAIWAAIGAFWPFVYVYYRGIGLSGTQIGLIVTLSALTGTLSATGWGLLNDRVGRTRLLLTIQAFGAIVVCLTLGQLRTFGAILLAAALFNVFTNPILPLLDTTTLGLLGQRRDQYGIYRMWGTIGFVITCAIAGFAIERIGMRLIFPAYSAGVLVFWLLARRLPDRPVARGGSPLAGVGQMMRQPAWVIFAVSVFILWFSVMGALAFLGIVITELGGTERTVGLAATIAALTEIPLFRYSARLLQRFRPARLLPIAMGVYAFRLLLYGLMPSVSWALGLALLQGASYGPFLVGAVTYADDAAPAGLKTTAQGLLVSVMSLANLVAGLSGGWLFDHTGRQGLFLTMTATCLVAVGLFGAGAWWARRLRVARP